MGIYTNKLDLIYSNNIFSILENEFEYNNIIAESFNSTTIISSIKKYWEKVKIWINKSIDYINKNYFKNLSAKTPKLKEISAGININYISNYNIDDLIKLERRLDNTIKLVLDNKDGRYDLDFDELDSKLNNNEDLKIESYFIDKNNIAFGQKIIDKNLDLQSSCQNFIKNINTIYKNKIDIALNSINANTKVVASFKLDGGVAKNNNIISLDYYKQLNKLIEILNKYCVNLFRLSEKISVCNLENYKSIAELEEKDN